MHRVTRPVRASRPSLCVAAVLWAALAGVPHAADAKLRAVIVEWGEVEVGDPAGPLGPEYQEHSLGQGHEVGYTRFLNHDDHVPAQLCRSFGFVAWLAGGPGDVLPERILMRSTHPMLTRPDGVSSNQDTLMLKVSDGVVRTSYGFDDPWEAVPGDWTFDLIGDGEVLASKTFVATKPAAGAAAPACPGRGVS